MMSYCANLLGCMFWNCMQCYFANGADWRETFCAIIQVNAQNSFSGATPLHCAAQENDRGDKEGRVLAIKMLLAAGADATIQVQTACILECNVKFG